MNKRSPKLNHKTIYNGFKGNKYKSHGKKLFFVEKECLYSVLLPSSVKKFNGQEVKPLETFTIPSNITKLSDYCFSNCLEVKEINGLEQIKEFGKYCFQKKFSSMRKFLKILLYLQHSMGMFWF